MDDAPTCLSHAQCDSSYFELFAGTSSRPRICIGVSDSGNCNDEYYADNSTNVLNKWAATNRMYDRDTSVSSVPSEDSTVDCSVDIANYTTEIEKCAKAQLSYPTYTGAYALRECENVTTEFNNLPRTSQKNIVSCITTMKVTVCVEATPKCYREFKYEKTPLTSTSDRECAPCTVSSGGDNAGCPKIANDYTVGRTLETECTVPLVFANAIEASAASLPTDNMTNDKCCRMPQSAEITQNENKSWTIANVHRITYKDTPANAPSDGICSSAQAQWTIEKTSCYDYTAILPNPVIRPSYAADSSDPAKRSCTSLTEFRCTFVCSAPNCNFISDQVVTGCDPNDTNHTWPIVDESANTTLTSRCNACALTLTTATSTITHVSPIPTTSTVSEKKHRRRHRHITVAYVGVVATAVLAWRFLFSGQ